MFSLFYYAIFNYKQIKFVSQGQIIVSQGQGKGFIKNSHFKVYKYSQ